MTFEITDLVNVIDVKFGIDSANLDVSEYPPVPGSSIEKITDIYESILVWLPVENCDEFEYDPIEGLFPPKIHYFEFNYDIVEEIIGKCKKIYNSNK